MRPVSRSDRRSLWCHLAPSGLTFFDDGVTAFFEPASAGRQVMYLAAVGHASS
jgi:hypothetical protein